MEPFSPPPPIDSDSALIDSPDAEGAQAPHTSVAPPPRGRGTLIAALLLMGAGAVVMLIRQWQTDPNWLLLPLALLLAAFGAWLHGRRSGDGLRLLLFALLMVIAAIAGGTQTWSLALFTAALGSGYLCAWGYARGHRGWWFSVALAVIVHLGLGAVGLVRIADGQGVWWSLLHGLGTLGAGGLLLWWSTTGTTVRRRFARKMGRIAIMLSLLLPYMALALAGLTAPS